MKQNAVYVIGAGGHAKVVMHSLRRAGVRVEAVFDDRSELWNSVSCGAPVLGPIERIVDRPSLPTVVAIGDNLCRRKIVERWNFEWFTLIDPQAVVMPDAELAPGTVVFPGAIVQTGARLGRHVIVNNAATVDHDCVVGDYVHLAPGVHLAGKVTIEEGAFLGIGSAVIPNVAVGAWSIVGAGSAVVRDLPAGVVAYGNPARPRRARNDDDHPSPKH